MPCVDSPVTCKIRSSTTTRTIKGDMQDWKLLGMQTEHINVLPVVPGICRFSINMQGTAMQEYLWSYTTVIQDRYTRFWGCLVNLTGKTCWGRADDVLTKCWGAKHDHIRHLFFIEKHKCSVMNFQERYKRTLRNPASVLLRWFVIDIRDWAKQSLPTLSI